MNKQIFNPTYWVYILVHGILILVGYCVVLAGGPIKTGIGSSLVAAGVTGWVVFVYVFLSKRISKRVQIVTDFGLTDAFAVRSVRIKAEYDRRLQRAHEAIDVMGFGMKTLREDYRDEFARWRERANVRILLLHPLYPDAAHSYARQRDTEERDTVGSIAANVNRFLEEIGPLVASSGTHRFDIRLYRCLPSVNVFRVDDEMFWGPYLVGGQSRNNPTFIVERGGKLFGILTAHFDAIWNDPELSVSITDYLAQTQTVQ
jgi:hypothetical protein